MSLKNDPLEQRGRRHNCFDSVVQNQLNIIFNLFSFRATQYQKKRASERDGLWIVYFLHFIFYNIFDKVCP